MDIFFDMSKQKVVERHPRAYARKWKTKGWSIVADNKVLGQSETSLSDAWRVSARNLP